MKSLDYYQGKVRGRLSEQQTREQAEDIKQRSITPDTHKVRYINDNEMSNLDFLNALLENSENEGWLNSLSIPQEENNSFYVDSYTHPSLETSRVLHFGINTYREGLREELEEHNSRIAGNKTLQEGSVISELNKSTKSDKEQIAKKEKMLLQYKMESSQILTKIEKAVTNTAIQFMQEIQQKTVLVDVFERDADGTIKSSLTTHTIVLYKQGNNYLVIDPSNAEFSTILIGASDDIRVCFNKKFQIYKPDGSTGSDLHQWRDCIDIAVKLAFNLNANSRLGLEENIKINELEGVSYIDYESLKNNLSIKEITNQKALNKNLHDIIMDRSIRIKQSSDVSENKKATAILITLEFISDKLHKILKEKNFTHSLNILNKKEELTLEKIFSNFSYKECIQKTIPILQEMDTPLYNIVQQDVDLLGYEFDNIDLMLSGV